MTTARSTGIAALAADLGHPSVRYSEHLTIEGAEGWRRVLDHYPPATPAEARRLLELLLAHGGIVLEPLPSWVCPELVATKAARDRLREWVEAGSIVPTPDDLVRGLKYVGDSEVRDILLRALHDDVAPPAVAYVLREYLFFGTGWSTGGWCGTVANPGGPLLQIVQLCGQSRDVANVRDLALHETAHAFTLATPARPLRAEDVSNEQGGLLLAAAQRPDLMRYLLAGEARDEEAADALARAWGGRLSCSAACANRYTAAQARHLDETYGDKGAAALPPSEENGS